MPIVLAPTTLSPLVPSQAIDGQQERTPNNTRASECILLPRSNAWHSNQEPIPFSPSCSKGKTQTVVTESISGVYTEESQEKHSGRAHHALPSPETQMSMEEVKVIYNL